MSFVLNSCSCFGVLSAVFQSSLNTLRLLLYLIFINAEKKKISYAVECPQQAIWYLCAPAFSWVCALHCHESKLYFLTGCNYCKLNTRYFWFLADYPLLKQESPGALVSIKGLLLLETLVPCRPLGQSLLDFVQVEDW